MTFPPNEPKTLETVRKKAATCVEDGADTLMCFVQDEGRALWRTDLVPIVPELDELDLVKVLAEEARANGLRFVAQFMGVHAQTHQMARHPSWLQRDAVGTPAAAMCLSSPFGRFLIQQVSEVVERYQVDGVYFDGLYARDGGCFCPYCRLRFEALYGRPMPAQATSLEGVTARADRHWLDFGTKVAVDDADVDAFRFATVSDYVAEMKSAIRSKRTDAALILDTVGSWAAYRSNAQDLRALGESVDAFALECYPDQIHEPSWHLSLEIDLTRAESRRPIWLLRWLANDPDGDSTSAPDATVDLHAGACIVHGVVPAPVEFGLYASDERLRPVVRRSFAAVARATEGPKTEPAAHVVLLHSVASKRLAAARGRTAPVYEAFAGAYLALLEAHIPVVVATEDDLERGDVPPDARVLLLPNAIVLRDETVDAIDRWLDDGKGLVATHMTGLIGPDGRPRTDPLGERLSIRTVGVGARAGRVGTEPLGGQEVVNFFRLDGDHEIVVRGQRLGSFSGAYMRVAEWDGEVLGWMLDSDYAVMDGERWLSWYPGSPSSPVAVAGQRGGRFVYIAAPLDRAFFREGSPDCADLLVDACRWAGGAPARVSVTAPPSVTAGIRREVDGPGWFIGLANRTTNDLYAIGPRIDVDRPSGSMSGSSGDLTIRAQKPRYIVPVADLEIHLRDARGMDVQVGGDLRLADVASTDDELVVRIDRLGAYGWVSVR
jgi:hypothetical protein